MNFLKKIVNFFTGKTAPPVDIKHHPVVKFLAEKKHVCIDILDLDAELMRDLDMDTLDMVEMAMAMEDILGVDLDEEETLGIRTIDDAINFYNKKEGL